ncbi:MAG TPA: helix-turn-helix domain-containing protein [Pyrinomonadaceae bacterium]|nr:helix-turn-helix domain-containing protein [Pyrinomonadaceae bacterium]
MKSSEQATDKIFARPPHFTVRYRSARRARWAGEARPDYAALFLIGGELRWRAEKFGAGDIGAGGALLAAPGDIYEAAGAGRAEYVELSLAPVYVLDCAVRARLMRADAVVAFRTHSIERDDRLARLARDMSEELLEESTGQEVVIDALVEQTLVHLLRRYANVRRSDELELSRVGLVDRRIRRAVELMHARLDADLPLEEIAAAAHLSPFHFARLFKKLTGATPHAYLANLRAARAQALLAETDLPITEIGARVGYTSSSHFAKAFRQATGISPSAYRAALVRRCRFDHKAISADTWNH